MIELFLKPARQDRQPHHFDQADVFLLDVEHLPMRMENPFRILLIRAIVPQNQVHLVDALVISAGNRSNRIVADALSVHFAERFNVR